MNSSVNSYKPRAVLGGRFFTNLFTDSGFSKFVENFLMELLPSVPEACVIRAT